MDVSLGAIGATAGSVSLVLIIIEKIYYLVNHKRVVSRCCGRTADMQLDIENTTPS
jgi:hypothetical protein